MEWATVADSPSCAERRLREAPNKVVPIGMSLKGFSPLPRQKGGLREGALEAHGPGKWLGAKRGALPAEVSPLSKVS